MRRAPVAGVIRPRQVRMHLVVFDVDGTLIDSYGLDADLYVDAVQRVLGITIDTDWAQYTNATDSGILEQVLEENGIEQHHENIYSDVKREFTRLIDTFIRDNPNALREIPGAKTFIEHLQKIENIALAIATGGWDTTATLKLHEIGLDTDQYALATASDARSRTEIIKIAVDRSLEGAEPDRVTYFGDGPWDKRASEALGYDFIGIGERVDHSSQFLDYRDVDVICKLLGV